MAGITRGARRDAEPAARDERSMFVLEVIVAGIALLASLLLPHLR